MNLLNVNEYPSHCDAWVIHKPSVGEYSPDCLSLERHALPDLNDNELLVRTIYVSLDPTYLNWLRLKETYVIPLAVGDVMQGVVLAEVVASRADGFVAGDVISAMGDWATYSIVSNDPSQVVTPSKLQAIPGVPLSANLTVFSHIGLVAIIGIHEIAKAAPGDVVLISGAAGAVGVLACEMAKAYGCKVIGIAGGAEKCRFLIDELGLDGAIDYKSDNIDEAVRRLCPDGVDIYFDNVGGSILDTVLMHLATRARVMICGAISQYNLADSEEEYGVKNLFRLVLNSARMEGFVPPDYSDRFEYLFTELGRLYAEGAITHRPHIVDGIESIAEAMGLLLNGGNKGKLIAKLASDPWS